MSATTTTINPRLRVRKAVPADADAIADINFAAFGDNIMNTLMYPQGVSEDARKKFTDRFCFPSPPQTTTTAAEGGAAPVPAAPREEAILCVAEYLPEGSAEDATGELVAFARWSLQREPRPAGEPAPPPFVATAETHGEGCDFSVFNTFVGQMVEKSEEHAKGEACLYLAILAVSPVRQRLGAGAALVQWGAELADSLNLPCRLEASPVGYGLYRKFGYEDVDVVDLKVTELWGVANTNGSNWGENNSVALFGPVAPGCLRSVIMRRPPKTVAA